MGDDVGVSVETLRRVYAETISRAVLSTDPEHRAALTALAAEVRAALGGVGVLDGVQATSALEPAPVSPWRSVATHRPATAGSASNGRRIRRDADPS